MSPDSPECRLLREMVEIPSVTGNEAAVAAHIARRMGELGMDAEVDPAGNAVGRISRPDAAGHAVDIILLGHMDTVPGDIPVRIENGELHGRGSVDAKGALAAFIVAASRAKIPEGVRLIVAGVTEEESVTSRGARHLLKCLSPAACIIGEPSHWNGVTLGYKGRLIAEYKRRRAMTHTASPSASAGDELCRWWERVRIASEAMRSSDRAFERVQATLRHVHSRSDGLYEEIEAVAGFRLPPGVLPEDIEEICRLSAPEDAELTFAGHEIAHTAERSNPVARALTSAIRSTGGTPHPKMKTGTSDMNVVGPVWRCPIAAYGPGDSALDHTPEERLPLDEYARAIEVLTRAIETLAAELAPKS